MQQESQNTTTQQIILGTVGEQKRFVLEQDYNHTALPKYKLPIKVNVNAIVFTKPTFKAFSKAKVSQSQNVSINFVDSLHTKPKFLKLELADRITVLNALNAKENRDVFQFLQNKSEAHLVTSISIAFNTKDITTLINAEEVFLEVDGIKNYALKTYKNGELQQTIQFNQGIIFGYQTSSCCWKQNDKYQLEIVDIVERNDQCPNKTYKSSKRAKKKINYYKF